MVTCLYSAKGGVGTTTFAAITSIATSRTKPTLAIDLCGDLPAVLGATPANNAGVYDWFAHLGDEPSGFPPLHQVQTPVDAALQVVAAGNKSRWCASVDRGTDQEWYTKLATKLLEAANSDDRRVIIDAGTLPLAETFVEFWAPSARLRWELALRAPQRVLVTRNCYLGLSAAATLPVPPTEIALVRDPGRALSSREVETAINAVVGVQVDVDASIGRAVDSGLATARLPRNLYRIAEMAANDA